MSNKKTVAILTNFAEFNPGYSLTGIVVDQAQMLLKNNHKVIIYVNESYNNKFDEAAGLVDLASKYGDQLIIERKTRFMHLKDYVLDDMNDDHKELSAEAGDIFFHSFLEHGVTIVLTHDFIFTGWNLPYFHAIIDTNNKLRSAQIPTGWFHWVHSVPSGNRDWWSLDKLGFNHSVVFPNKTEIMRVAESFKIPSARVKIIPHIKDIRNWYDFSDETNEILDRYTRIMDSEIVQVYPCSTDRLEAKQLGIVIELFAIMKIKTKVPVFLVIANQWATGRQRKEDIQKYIDHAETIGLIYERDFIFTSELKEEYAIGISRKIIRELQLISNLFVFPTREESFGLVGPEAAFSGAMVVTNRSLHMMQEVMSIHPPSFDFGSFSQKVDALDDPGYIEAVAMAILNRLYSNEAIMTKTYCRMKYNMDSIYTRYYLPVMG